MIGITLVLLIIFITNQFVHYVNVAATGQITMWAVMQLMSLQVPLLLGYLLPLGLYLSILLVLGRWYIDSEMTVLSACGMSWGRIFAMVMAFAVVVMIFVAMLMLWLEPIVQGYRTEVLENSIEQATMNKLIPSQFRDLPQGGVFYAGNIKRAEREMDQVFFAMRSGGGNVTGKGPWDVTISDRAYEVEYPDNPGRFLVFQNGYRYIGAPGEKNFRLIKFKKYGVRLVSKHFTLSDWPNNASTPLLWKVRHQDLAAAAMLQWRLAMPISVILFALLAIPLSRVKPRQGKFAQFLPAILIYIAYADLMFLGRAWIQKGVISQGLGLWWIHGTTLLLACLIILHKLGWKNLWRKSPWSFYAHP